MTKSAGGRDSTNVKGGAFPLVDPRQGDVEDGARLLDGGRHNRLNEISFNSPLMKELRMIAPLRQVADPGHGEGARWAGMRTREPVLVDLALQGGGVLR